MSDASPLQSIGSRLGYRFSNEDLLWEALSHRSWANDVSPPVADNERLEFLGDAVLGLLVAEALIHAFPTVDEGRLTAARTRLVRAPSLARSARALALGGDLRLGRGEREQGGADKDSILSDAYEAVLGAIFVDGGLEAAREFVLRTLGDALRRRGSDGGPYLPANPRGRLQELLQRQKRGTPTYEVLVMEGPPHERRFEIAVVSGDTRLGVGEGGSKKEASEAAAQAALASLQAPS